MGGNGRKRVAIACQGGGSHAAFTAGALMRLLGEGQDRYEVVALSGTSGGAICAFLAWHALLDGDRKRAIEQLDAFWTEDNAARSFEEAVANAFVLGSRRLAETTGVVPLGNPYYFLYYALPPLFRSPDYWQDRLGQDLEERTGGVELRGRVTPSSPMLLVGAVNVLTGDFQVFRSHRPAADGSKTFLYSDDRDDGISVEAVLASAAVPFVFKAVRNGRAVYREGRGSPRTRIGEGVYWDGLYSQNPPIGDLIDAEPDEIWVVQVNPEEIHREPRATAEIWDRRNELAGNLSLNQELRFVRETNGLARRHGIPKRIVKARRIELSIPLEASSKLDRSPAFIERLIEHGEDQADHFLRALPAQLTFEEALEAEDPETVLDLFDDGAEVVISPPSGSTAPELRREGRNELCGWAEWCASRNLRVEQTRDHRADGASATCWLLAIADGLSTPIKARAQITPRNGKTRPLTLYPADLPSLKRLKAAGE